MAAELVATMVIAVICGRGMDQTACIGVYGGAAVVHGLPVSAHDPEGEPGIRVVRGSRLSNSVNHIADLWARHLPAHPRCCK